MPFKWSATRIQVLPNQGQGSNLGPHQNNMGAMKTNMTPQYSNQPGHMQQSLMAQQQAGLMTMRDNRASSRMDRQPRGMDRDRSMRDRRRSPPKRERSPVKSRSPRRSPSRGNSTRREGGRKSGPRYSVQIPKISMDIKDGNVPLLRSRYSNMYIPSDFFRAKFAWQDAFPPHRPQSLAHECGYHVMHRESLSVDVNDAVLEPSDASHLYSAKVMLLALPGLMELYRRSCPLAEEESHDSLRHPTRMIQFLVGLKGKAEPLAIGGPWSASLDGANPKDDPNVLINTAKRTCRALTGIDLSGCTQWYRFAEIQYHRAEETRKGRHLAARVETTVIFLPDVWSCVPSSLDWEKLQARYLQLVADKDNQENEEETEEMEEEPKEEDKKPTHYSELDVKNMKVADIRFELEARKLNSKGMKAQLLARLTKALKSEKEEAEELGDDANQSMEDEDCADGDKVDEDSQDSVKVKQEPDAEDKDNKNEESSGKKKLDPEVQAEVERLYKLPADRAIVVHPNKEAKSGKFDCTVMSLSVLLDYRPEDNKEHSFEVSLFAELFNEMIMRDFGFNIYKALTSAPEKEDKKEKKEDKDDKEAKRRKTDDDGEKTEIKKEADKTDDKMDDDSKDEGSDQKKSSESREEEEVARRTVDPQLLLSCVYFDLNHCGYLNDKDIQEIFHTLGLQISRGQINRLVEKVCVKDQWNYRKFTDRPVTEVPAPLYTLAADPQQLATGNKHLIDGQQLGAASAASPRTKAGKSGPVSDSGVVTYRGALVDVGSVLDKLGQSDDDRTKLEAKLSLIRNEMEKIKEAHVDDLTKIANLRKDLEDQKAQGEKLTKDVQHLQTANTTLAEFARSVRHLAEDVQTTVEGVLAPDINGDDGVETQ